MSDVGRAFRFLSPLPPARRGSGGRFVPRLTGERAGVRGEGHDVRRAPLRGSAPPSFAPACQSGRSPILGRQPAPVRASRPQWPPRRNTVRIGRRRPSAPTDMPGARACRRLWPASSADADDHRLGSDRRAGRGRQPPCRWSALSSPHLVSRRFSRSRWTLSSTGHDTMRREKLITTMRDGSRFSRGVRLQRTPTHWRALAGTDRMRG